MAIGGQYCMDTNTLYTIVDACCNGEDQANGHTSLQATKADPATPVPPTIGCMGRSFDTLLDLTC